MFTGIIEATGTVERLARRGGDWRLEIRAPQLDFSDVKEGDSISVSGVCLTVVALKAQAFEADVSNETIDCTAMRALGKGSRVNLEKAMTPRSRLGGHIVSGHVDGVAELTARRSDARSERLTLRAPRALARYIAPKGSVCLDGVSLTVNEVRGEEFCVNIIPHTAMQTTIGDWQPGRGVNLEVDLLSRYLERLLLSMREEGEPEAGPLSFDFLAKNGFAKP